MTKLTCLPSDDVHTCVSSVEGDMGGHDCVCRYEKYQPCKAKLSCLGAVDTEGCSEALREYWPVVIADRRRDDFEASVPGYRLGLAMWRCPAGEMCIRRNTPSIFMDISCRHNDLPELQREGRGANRKWDDEDEAGLVRDADGLTEGCAEEHVRSPGFICDLVRADAGNDRRRKGSINIHMSIDSGPDVLP
jgi:hypothetical protein